MLQRSLVSLAVQTYKDFDVHLVVNGCSDDAYQNIAKFMSLMPYKNTIHYSKLRLGAGKSVRYASYESNANYICRLDADDEYTPTKLFDQLRYMRKNKDVDFCFTSAYNRTKSLIDSPYYGDTEYLTDAQIKRALISENVLIGSTFMCKRKTLFEIGGYQTTPWREDYDTWLLAVANGCVFAKMKERLYIYTQGTSVER